MAGKSEVEILMQIENIEGAIRALERLVKPGQEVGRIVRAIEAHRKEIERLKQEVQDVRAKGE